MIKAVLKMRCKPKSYEDKACWPLLGDLNILLQVPDAQASVLKDESPLK
jgi:hypothetical protein